MNNLWINWRFGTWHLQIGRDRPFVAFRQNGFWLTNKPAKWFEAY